MQTATPVQSSWAKLVDGSALSIADHGCDVAAVMDALLRSGWQSRIETAAGRALTGADAIRLSALAFLHDIGKANRGFWKRQFGPDPRMMTFGHTAEVLAAPPGGRAERVLSQLSGIADEALLRAMLAHHGRPVPADVKQEREIWEAFGGYDPVAEVGTVLAEARRRFPSAWLGRPLGLPDAAVSLFAGLLTLADWIGSDTARFPIDGVTGPEREDRSRRVAAAAVAELGLGDAGAFRPQASRCAFDTAFGFLPNPGQDRAGEIGKDRLTILESDTGSGKTEAALWRFLRLLARGDVDALYFALPTRTSAVQIHDRVRRAMDTVFDSGGPAPVLAVPGYLRAGDQTGLLAGRFSVLWPDREADRVEDARWAAEAPKRFLAARVAIGTIDQVLMSGLKLRHAHLRAACLSRTFLVVDEVHASDTYMTEVLAQVLANHARTGGHAMLLSATLGSASRVRFTQGPRAAPPPLDVARGLAYPALNGIGFAAATGRDKEVTVDLAPDIANAGAVAARALAAARAGARVLVLRNTVADAVATQQALEALQGSAGHLFRVADIPTLHHGRFAPADRRLLDRAIEQAFDPGRGEGPGLIATGTQTLEISLDLDADFMITDLAPVDVLLQRFGRLHRRRGRPRPAEFSAARAVVLVPASRDLSPFLHDLPRRFGLGQRKDGGGTYRNLPAIEATWAMLESRGIIRTPADNRALVEGATHPEALDAIVRRLGWGAAWARLQGTDLGERQQARANSLDLSAPFRKLVFPDRDQAVRTRLGDSGLQVRLAEAVPGAFRQLVQDLTIPAFLLESGLQPDLPDPVATPEDGGFGFKLGGRAYGYDRFGLVRR